MSENDNSRFSWLGQLQELLYDSSANSVLKSVLDPVFYHLNTLNPEAPKVQIEKNTSDAETFNPTAPTAQTNNRNTDDAETLIPKEPNFRRIQKEAIYDKVYEDFIFNYKRFYEDFIFNYKGFNHEGSAFDDQKLRGEFNSLLIKKYNKDNPTNNLKKLTKPEKSIASLAFSITLTRLSEVDNLRASKGEFELLLTNQTELHAIIAKKYLDKYPNAFSVVDEQGSLKNKDENSKPEAPNADCPSAFSVVKDYLFNATSAATTFLTSTASSFVSFMFDSNKAPNSQSNQDSVQQKTATMPTGNQTPGTAPETGEYKTKIGPMQKAVGFDEDTPPQLRSLIGLNSPSNSSRSN